MSRLFTFNPINENGDTEKSTQESTSEPKPRRTIFGIDIMNIFFIGVIITSFALLGWILNTSLSEPCLRGSSKSLTSSELPSVVPTALPSVEPANSYASDPMKFVRLSSLEILSKDDYEAFVNVEFISMWREGGYEIKYFPYSMTTLDENQVFVPKFESYFTSVYIYLQYFDEEEDKDSLSIMTNIFDLSNQDLVCYLVQDSMIFVQLNDCQMMDKITYVMLHVGDNNPSDFNVGTNSTTRLNVSAPDNNGVVKFEFNVKHVFSIYFNSSMNLSEY